MAEPAEPAVRYARRQDTKFWFEDGTVILVVRHIEFRVYKGILANQSPIFADMFSFSQPPQSTPPCFESSSSTTHICPFVQLSDSLEDLRHFLRVCMPEQRMHSLFRLPPLSTPSYHMVSALIRLGSKYQMDYLVTDAMDYLKQCYAPKHWQEWAAGRLYDIDAPFQRDHAIGVINLAHLVDEPVILPAALLVCCSLQGEEIVDGFACEDGSWMTLPLDDISRCFAARTYLAQQGFELVLHLFALPVESPRCTTPAQCAKELQNRQLDAIRYQSNTSHSDVFVHAAHILRSVMDCTSYQKMLSERYVRLGADFWHRLPYLFRVDLDWDDY